MPLEVEHRDRVAILTLDDPERRNALSAEMVDGIAAAVDAAEADDNVGALVVTGAPPAFCSGADTSSIGAMSGTDRDASPVSNIYEGFLSVRRCTLPTVAAVNGPAVGAGFNLALCCDVRVAGTSARFDARFAQIGIHPGGGHTWMLERAVGPQAAAAIALFGERIDGRARPSSASSGAACPTTRCSTRRSRWPPPPPRSRETSPAVKATLREVPWQPDFEAAVATELERQRRSFRQRPS